MKNKYTKKVAAEIKYFINQWRADRAIKKGKEIIQVIFLADYNYPQYYFYEINN